MTPTSEAVSGSESDITEIYQGENQEYFSREKSHQILMSSWDTLVKRLRNQPRGVAVAAVVRIDITQSCRWPKVIAGASEKARPELVGDGIKECFLEISDTWKNARTGKAQPLFVLTHLNNWQVLYHPKKDEGLLAFRRRDDPHGDLRFDKAEPDKEDRTLAFELAANFKEKKIAGKIKHFQTSHRSDGWEPDDFEIGSNDPNSQCKVWAWVLSQELQQKWFAWLANPAEVNQQEVPQAYEHPKAWRQAAEHHEDQIQLDPAEVDDGDGVSISNAIHAVMDSKHFSSVDAVLDFMKMTHAEERARKKVKKEGAEEKKVVEVCKLYYSQARISNRFRGGPYGGKLLEEFIDGLKGGKDHPIRDDWITLRVLEDVRFDPPRLRSLDNRRLFCLKAYQKYLESLGTGKVVEVNTKLCGVWTEQHSEFVRKNDSSNGGTEVWNVNAWHWEEKPMTDFSIKWLSRELQGLSLKILSGLAELEFRDVQVTGDASVTVRKGKPIILYLLRVESRWEAAGTAQGLGEAKGSLILPELSSEDGPNSSLIQIETTSDTSRHRLGSAVRKEGIPAVRALLRKFEEALRSTLQKATVEL
eukprot:s1909_g7.t2